MIFYHKYFKSAIPNISQNTLIVRYCKSALLSFKIVIIVNNRIYEQNENMKYALAFQRNSLLDVPTLLRRNLR